jgi:hypothetical protein
MTLRKKHIRRIVAASIFVVVAVPLAAMVLTALGLRGNAYGDAIAAQLAARLHCDAAIRGARPASPGEAAADSLELSWQTSSGPVTFRLDGITATLEPAGWNVKARQGGLSLKVKDLREALSALNQRLVQPGKDRSPQVTLAVEAFTVTVDSDLATLEERGRLKIERGIDTPLMARFETPGNVPEKIKMTVHMDPHSPAGVFQVARAHLDHVPAGRFATCLLGPEHPRELAGTVKIDVTWARSGRAQPKQQESEPAREVLLSAEGLDLAQWTAALPGGPIRAKDVALALEYTEETPGRTRTTVSLVGGDGDLGPETLRWLEGLPAGLKARPASTDALHVMFDRLQVRCTVQSGRGQFSGSLGMDGTTPILADRAAAASESPILGAAGGAFDASALWSAISRALAGTDGEDK